MKIGDVGEKNKFGEYHGGYSTEYGKHVADLKECPFCNRPEKEIVLKKKYSFITTAKFPYSKNHILIIPIRHVESILDLNKEEKKEIHELIEKSLKILLKEHHNVSVLLREGELGKGKTIAHAHYNLIPDVPVSYRKQPGQQRKLLTDKEIAKIVQGLVKKFK